jgi:predicted nucleotidyltransferase component of viral defense system
MTSRSPYYEEKLYPLQDGILNTLKSCGARFYLTGGTALSRGYYHHRYSDDLDFFLNADAEYLGQVDLVFKTLKENGFVWDESNDFIKSPLFHSIKVSHNNCDSTLKLDFVNDVPAHFGGFIQTDVFHKTDSVRNILSNKLGAIFRFEPKDIADIREIALHERINWFEIISETRQKDAGIELPEVCEVLYMMREEEFNSINWITKPNWLEFKSDIRNIISDMLNAGISA